MSRYSLKRVSTQNDRPKAFWGTVIAAALSAGAQIYNNYKNRQAEVNNINNQIAAQNRQIEEQNKLLALNNQANTLNNYYMTENNYKKNLNRDLIYGCGGRKSLRAATGAKVKITDGGIAIPIGDGNFLLRGSSHNQVNESGHTGIGLKVGNRTIEAEGGEVIRPTNKSLLIYSRRLPLANGLTPAQSVLAGYNPSTVFAAQQQENGNNQTPVKGNRKKAAFGSSITPYDWVNLGADVFTALGTGIGNAIGYKKLNTKLAKPTYYEETPVILDTTYHNAAQLASLDRMRLAGNRTIGRNTASSQVAQNRMRLNNLDYALKRNELMDYKANQEAALRNTQAQIEQGVRQRNIAAKNLWSQQVADTINKERELENNRTLMLTQNHGQTLAGINRGLSNFNNSILQRQQDNRALQAMIAASNPGSYGTFVENGGLTPEESLQLWESIYNKSSKTEDDAKLAKAAYNNLTQKQRDRLKKKYGIE